MSIFRKSSIVLVVAFSLIFCGLLPSQAMAARTLNGTMTGVVLNEAGKAVANTSVYVFQKQWEATDGFGNPCWTKYIKKTITGKSGQYKFSLPAGEYRVWFVPEKLDTYAMEAYPDAAYIAIGDTVKISSGQTTSRISVTLDTPGKITGYVEDAVTHNRMGNIPIALCVQDTCIINSLRFVNTVETGDNIGYFEINGLKPFPWQLWVNVPFYCADPSQQPVPAINYQSGYKDFQMYAFDKYAWLPSSGETQPIDLYFDGDPDTPAVDVIKLEPNNFLNLEGYVKDQFSGEPIEGLTIKTMVAEYSPDGEHAWEDFSETTSDADGYFKITGLTQYRGRVVIYTFGDTSGPQQYYDEYCNDAGNEWGAEQFEIRMGETIELSDYFENGVWWINPIH